MILWERKNLLIQIKKLNLHQKPCGILNINGYFNDIKNFLNNSVSNGFVQQEFVDMIVFEETPQFILDRFISYKHPKVEKKLEVE